MTWYRPSGNARLYSPHLPGCEHGMYIRHAYNKIKQPGHATVVSHLAAYPTGVERWAGVFSRRLNTSSIKRFAPTYSVLILSGDL